MSRIQLICFLILCHTPFLTCFGAEEISNDPFVRDKPPETKVIGPHSVEIPPGEPRKPDNMVGTPEIWRLKTGKTIKFFCGGYAWRPFKSADGKDQWVLTTNIKTPAGFEDLRLDTLDPSERNRILDRVWYTYHFRVDLYTEREEGARKAEKWVDRIALYTGKEPRPPGEEALPLLDERIMREAPDIRAFFPWVLNDRKGFARKVGKFKVLDWATDEDAGNWSDAASSIPVRIEFEDGTKETVCPAVVRKGHLHYALMLGFWRDWAALVAAGGEIPGRDRKIRALMDTLPVYWKYSKYDREAEKRTVAAANNNDAAERTRAYRWGYALAIPGLPPAGFKQMDTKVPDRTLIPVLDQGPLGARASDCLPSSIATFFLWWDEQNSLPLGQKKGDRMKKADWLHTQLAREMRTLNNRGTSWSGVSKGLADFSKRFLGSRYSFQVNLDYDYSPANVARYVQGGHATVMTLTLWNGQRESGGHAVSVLEATEDGKMTIATWGMKLSGTWKETKLRKSSKPQPGQKQLPAYELELSGLSDKDKKELRSYRFILDSSNWDGIACITPFVSDGKAPQKP